ncbi:MAG: hypothetical protein Q8736_02765, partial [Sweet potato little leaf phytoplasma]|nr:hypothetical protein [Sweet potato little leaf phytoplasma]
QEHLQFMLKNIILVSNFLILYFWVFMTSHDANLRMEIQIFTLTMMLDTTPSLKRIKGPYLAAKSLKV